MTRARSVHRMCGSTPRGRSRSYQYYITINKPFGLRRSVSCSTVDEQIPYLLKRVSVNPEAIPKIRELYSQHIDTLRGPSAEQRSDELRELIARYRVEEAALARLYAQGKLSDENYDSLYAEWKTKLSEADRELYKLGHGSKEIVDDLETALGLLGHLDELYRRLDRKVCSRLLRILFKHIIINTQGRIIDFELNPPFQYLHHIAEDTESRTKRARGGSNKFLSSPPITDKCQDGLPTDEVGQFLSMVRFENRYKLEELSLEDKIVGL